MKKPQRKKPWGRASNAGRALSGGCFGGTCRIQANKARQTKRPGHGTRRQAVVKAIKEQS